MDLHALEDLKRLKYRYLRTLDQKQWDDFGETLAPEATADYGPALAFVGRSTIVEFMRSSLGAEIITEHHVGHPEIEIDGDTATGTWYLQDVVIARSQRMILRGAAFTRTATRALPRAPGGSRTPVTNAATSTGCRWTTSPA